MPVFASDTLHALMRAACLAGGSAEREATLVAGNLVEANLTGHDSTASVCCRPTWRA